MTRLIETTVPNLFPECLDCESRVGEIKRFTRPDRKNPGIISIELSSACQENGKLSKYMTIYKKVRSYRSDQSGTIKERNDKKDVVVRCPGLLARK